MDNPEKLATYTVHKTKKNRTKNATQYVLDTTIRKQTQNNVYKKLTIFPL